MYLSKLLLRKFRNYNEESIELNKGINIIIGDNAQGKTNILESIHILSVGKSHRSVTKDNDLINKDEDSCYISGTVERINGNYRVDMIIDKREKKKISINGVALKRVGELLGTINTVIFSPEDLKIVKEGPSERRRFLDIAISQLKPQYFYFLNQYLKILNQRNTLLKSIDIDAIEKNLEVWDQQLVEVGSRIIQVRNEYIDRLAIFSKEIHGSITEGKEELKIAYSPSFNINNINNFDEIKSSFDKTLRDKRREDIRRNSTSIGPHRDDIKITINSNDIKVYGSQGQQRTAVLSLKVSELELIKSDIGEYPILLLDDVMSELDNKRQLMLIQSLKDIQTIITTTDILNIKEDRIKSSNIYVIQEGRVIEQIINH